MSSSNIIDINTLIEGKTFPIEFPTREDIEQILTQRQTAMLLDSGKIEYKEIVWGQNNHTQPELTLYAEAYYVFPADHPFLIGHWDDHPLVHNVMLIEMIGQTGNLLLALIDPHNENQLKPSFIGSTATYGYNVRPGDRIMTRTWVNPKNPPTIFREKDKISLISGSLIGQAMICRSRNGQLRPLVVTRVEDLKFEAKPCKKRVMG